jgi:hypothetical protein
MVEKRRYEATGEGADGDMAGTLLAGRIRDAAIVTRRT